jgi:hypothetical protein
MRIIACIKDIYKEFIYKEFIYKVCIKDIYNSLREL